MTEQDREESQSRWERESEYFRQKLGDIERIGFDLTNLILLLGQTQLDERQQNYLSRIRTLNIRLTQLSGELKEQMERLSGVAEEIRRPFNINTLLESSSDVVQEVLRRKAMKLIYDVDHSVPAKVQGDALLLEDLLVELLKILIELDGQKNLIVRLALDEPPSGSGEPLLRFEFRFEAQSQEEMERLKALFFSSATLRRMEQTVHSLGGVLIVGNSESMPLISLALPVHRLERRSYRLPSPAWMKKKMLIVISDDAVAGALKDMLEYFHFQVDRAAAVEKALPLLYEKRYDMIFVDDTSIESFVEEAYNLRRSAHIVLVTEDVELQQKNRNIVKRVDAFLTEPFTQQGIFNLLLDVYSRESLEGLREILGILRENISFLLQGKTVLYIGRRDLDRMAVERLLEGAEIAVISVDSALRARQILPSTDLVILSDRLEDREWEKILALCMESCEGKPVLALMHKEDDDGSRADALKLAGIEHILPTPVDPESFYRKILDLMLAE